MKRLYGIVIVASALASSALAQQPSTDPALNACQQLLAGANSTVIQLAAQTSTLSQQLDKMKAELAAKAEEKK